MIPFWYSECKMFGQTKELMKNKHYPFSAQRPKYRTFNQNFNFNLKKGTSKKKFLWVGRRKEPFLGCPEK